MQYQNSSAFVGHYPELCETFFALEDFSARCGVLLQDVTDCAGPHAGNLNSQFWRRTIIRNVFVYLEASSYGFKDLALRAGEKRYVEFSLAELTILKEEKHCLGENGQASSSGNNFQRFIPNLQFAFNCFAKAVGRAVRLDMSKVKVSLKEFEQLRNRLTHPKKLGDLTVTDAELKTANTVHNWYSCELRRLMGAAKETTVKAPPPVRMTPANPISRLRATKDYIVMQPDGNVYHFDTRAEAEDYKRCQISKDQTGLTPLVYHKDDLLGSEGLINRLN